MNKEELEKLIRKIIKEEIIKHVSVEECCDNEKWLDGYTDPEYSPHLFWDYKDFKDFRND